MTHRRHRIEFDDRNFPTSYRTIDGRWTVRLGDVVMDDQVIAVHVRGDGREVNLLADIPFRRGEVVELLAEMTREGCRFVCMVEETERD